MAVRAAGLNFRDVLIALGMYPEANADRRRGRGGGAGGRLGGARSAVGIV